MHYSDDMKKSTNRPSLADPKYSFRWWDKTWEEMEPFYHCNGRENDTSEGRDGQRETGE